VGLSALLTAALVAADPSIPPGLSNAEVAERAEAAFREGVSQRGVGDRARPHFRAAAELFEELRRRGADNAALSRNLGNAYLLADDLPHAILSYRHGLRLAPHDRDLRAGLAQARELVVYPAGSTLGRPPRDDWPPWLPRLRSEWMFVAAVVCYVVAWIFLTRWLMIRGGRLLGAGLFAFGGAAALTVAVVLAARRDDRETGGSVVVIAADGVLLRKGNNLNFPPRFETPLNRGVEARLLFERDDWLQIELAGGEVGWIPRPFGLVDSP
jgi:hypothetical protein